MITLKLVLNSAVKKVLPFTKSNIKSDCIVMCYEALYAQQHPTRLGKQLHPQTVGLLFSAIRKYNNQSTYRQLPQGAGNAL